MAIPTDISRTFRLYVTHVDGEGHFLKISGQLDQQASLMVESLFESARENLERGIGSITSSAIQEGVICAAKYKDGTYYRAKIINTSNLANGLVGVHFIDYGNKDIISLSTIRFLEKYDPMFLQLRGQASDYYLARIMPLAARWEEPVLLKLQSLLCYAEYPATIEATTRTLPIIAMQFRGQDLSTHLVGHRFGIPVATAKQEVLLMQLLATDSQQAPNWQQNYLSEPSYPEHVPFLVNQNFPSNPASAMRLHQNVTLPFNGNVPPPSLISQRLLVSANKASRTPVNVKGPFRQPQQTIPIPVAATMTPPQTTVASSNKPSSPKKSSTYKTRLLEVGSHHKVFVSFAEEGPELFAVQLVTDANKLQDMMDDINKRPHSSLAEPPMIGTVCLGRMSGDRIICRAIVMNLSGSQCKLFFVDFGDTEMVSYYDIFDIPEEFVKPNVFAIRYCLSGVKKLEKGPHLTEAFKQLVNGKVLTLRVVAPEGPPLIQYGELFLDNTSVLDLLLASMKDKLQFKWLEMLPLGSKNSVLVSYVDSCIKFFVQLSENIDELNAVMDAVKVHCENSTSPGELPIGAACCARFPDDDNWYRAHVRSTHGNKIIVAYVDYGNEQEVSVSDLRTMTPELIRLPAQAMKCALKGYENKPVETKTSNQLEMLALEKTLMAHVVGTLSNDTMLVTLIDDTVSPPLDVARRMTQLSTPRSTNAEPKPTTPVRKDAPETFSSPEGSEDNWKKGFKREKSFKDDRERRPRDQGGEEFGQRGSSFRGRDNKEAFERSGPGRHSDKFGGRPDRPERPERTERHDRPERGERRGGSKPWENNSTAAPAPAPSSSTGDDEWEESPTTQPAFNPSSRQNNQRRKPRPEQHEKGPRDHERYRPEQQDRPRPDYHDRRTDHHDRPRPDHDRGPRPGWKSKDSGIGKRLRQPTDGSSDDSQNQKFSVQDRLRRDNRFSQQNNEHEQNKQDDWGNKNRPDRRDNRGDRRDNWGDKKENFQKREYRDNNRERGERDFRDNNRERGERDFRDNNRERGEREFRDNNRERGERDFRDNNRERGDRTRSNYTPRDRADRSFNSDNDKRSEKSFRSQDSGGRAGRAPPYKSRSKFTQVQYKELSDPIPLETPFEEATVETGAQYEISVTWIISPESFYTQILTEQPKFLEMMHKIPELYKGVKSYTGLVPVGASVLARYPADGVLYRATVVSAQPFSKFIVRYVDFGNKQLVDAKDIWQLDRQLMVLPKMAVHCSLLGVAPKEGEWKANPEIDLCFNAPRYQCVFQECVDGHWQVYLWNNSVSVGENLIEKELAVPSEHQSSVALKDEAIDLTIIVGQQILCKVTHVKSYAEFYVQLDLEKAALVENAIASFDNNKLTPLTQETLADGVHCTVRHEGKVYRAILESTQDPDKIQAVLPDYGFSITTSLANLMILPTELSVYYYQSLQCGLNNYNSSSKLLMTEAEMKEKLTGNKFIIYIDHVDAITLMSTLYEMESGQKVAMFSPDAGAGAHEEVGRLCARAVFNYNFGMAYISHADNLNELFLQKASDSDKIALLLDELYKFYEEGTPEALESFEAESLCAAKSSDGNWYRATVLSATDADATVHFSDYGNSETVAKDNVKKLHPKFFEPCSLALAASLGLVALQEDALSKLLEWTTDKEVQVTLAFGTDGWLASLHLDGVDLSIKLVNEKLATPKVSAEEEKTEVPGEEPISLPPGCTQVYISHIDTPGHFWLQMVDKEDKIDEIQAELQENAASYPDVESRDLGTLCVAKYLADDQWYRAEILDADADITTVRFTDYGNTDVLDNQPGLIKVLPDHLREIERYALKSSVNAVPTGTGEWSEAASEYFNTLVGDITTPVDALIVLKDVTTYVDIFVNGQNITNKLVSEGYATKSEEPECGGDLPSCFASHINSPSEFWIQLESATAELQAMEAAMVDAEHFPALGEKEEGVLCAAKYPEDGEWYRAQVIVDGSEGTEVLFMDYGNASIANELRSLPDELKSKPALSRKCALQKPRDIKSWSRKSEEKFNELAAEGATIFNVQFIASGDISIVELYLEGKSVTEELVGLCEAQPATERPTPVGQDLRCAGKVCYVYSLEEFHVQLDDSAAEIDNILDKMAGAADFESVSELKIGSLCAAFWDEDEQWYRGKILEFCDGGYHVQFIDYGNKAKCEEVRQLPENLNVIEPAAKCCRLAGLGGEASLIDAAKNQLDEFASEAVTFQIEFIDSTKEPALVKLFLDGKDFCSIIPTETKNDSLSESIVLDNTPKVIIPEVEPTDKEEQLKLDERKDEESSEEKTLEVTNTVDKSQEEKVITEEIIQEQSNIAEMEEERSLDEKENTVDDSKTVENSQETIQDTVKAIQEQSEIKKMKEEKSSEEQEITVEKTEIVENSQETMQDIMTESESNIQQQSKIEKMKEDKLSDEQENTVEQTETIENNQEPIQNTVKESESNVQEQSKIKEIKTGKSSDEQENTVEHTKTIENSHETIQDTVKASESDIQDLSKIEEIKVDKSSDKQETTVEHTKTIEKSQEKIQEYINIKIDKESESNIQDKIDCKEIIKENIQEQKESIKEDEKEKELPSSNELLTDIAEEDSELNTSLPELNDSIGSNKTVIENKSFEGKEDSSAEEFADANDVPQPSSPEKDVSGDTLENSNEASKTPERDDSKDSLNTDTGYTSENDKLSPMKEEMSTSPVKTSFSPKKKSTEIIEDSLDQTNEDYGKVENKESTEIQEENLNEADQAKKDNKKEKSSEIKVESID